MVSENETPAQEPEKEAKESSKPDRLALVNAFASMRGCKPGFKQGTKLAPEVQAQILEEYALWVESRISALMGEGAPHGFSLEEFEALRGLAQKVIAVKNAPPGPPQPQYQQQVYLPQIQPDERPHSEPRRLASRERPRPARDLPPAAPGGPQPLVPAIDHEKLRGDNEKLLLVSEALERLEASGPSF
jgi:hypothetical protein